MGVRIREKGGAWWVFVNHKGRRKARKVGTKEAALKAKKLIEARLAAIGAEALEEKKTLPTLREFAECWLSGPGKAALRASTLERYRGDLRRHIYPALGSKRLDEITRADVRDLLARLALSLKRSTATITLQPLARLLNVAEEDGLIEKSPARRLGSLLGKAPRREEPDPLSREEAEAYLATIREHFPEAYEFPLTMLRTGARPGEVAALRWEDVDFGRGVLHIRRTFSKGRVGETKTGERRAVDLSAELAEALGALLRRRKAEALRGGRGEVCEWVFPNPKRTRPVDFGTLADRAHRRALAKAGVRHRHLKELRHTCASILLSEGTPVLAVSKLLGHRSPKMTLDVYARWIPQEGPRVVDRLDARKSATYPQPGATGRRNPLIQRAPLPPSPLVNEGRSPRT